MSSGDAITVNLRQLEAFQATVAAGSATGAAEALGVSQPAISRLLANLESELGFNLFERRGRRLVPTPEALVLCEEVNGAFLSIQKVIRRARRLREQDSGRLRVIGDQSSASGFLARVADRFTRDHPKVTVNFAMQDYGEAIKSVADHSADLAVQYPAPNPSPGLTSEVFHVNRAFCIMTKDHPLANRDSVSSEDLDPGRLIMMPKTLKIRHLLDTLFENVGKKITPRVEVESCITSCALALDGAGVGFVNPLYIPPLFEDKLAVVPFEPIIEFKMAFIYSNAAPPTRLLHSFMDYVRDEVAQTEGGRPPNDSISLAVG